MTASHATALARLIHRLDRRLRLRPLAGHADQPLPAPRGLRRAPTPSVHALRATDQLVAQYVDNTDVDHHLMPSLAILINAIDRLQDAVYQAESIDQSHRADDLALNRAIAEAAGCRGPWREPPSYSDPCVTRWEIALAPGRLASAI